MALSELDSETGKVTRMSLIAVDKALLSAKAGSGIDPRLNRAGVSLASGANPNVLDTQRSSVARDRIENEKLVRITRSLHAAWRDAFRTPLRNFRRRLRDAEAERGAQARHPPDVELEAAVRLAAARRRPSVRGPVNEDLQG